MSQSDHDADDADLSLTDDSPNWDHRDREVLDVLRRENPDTVTLTEFQRLYRQCTDICRKDTLKDRIRFLTTYGPFERERGQTWRYLGDGE